MPVYAFMHVGYMYVCMHVCMYAQIFKLYDLYIHQDNLFGIFLNTSKSVKINYIERIC